LQEQAAGAAALFDGAAAQVGRFTRRDGGGMVCGRRNAIGRGRSSIISDWNGIVSAGDKVEFHQDVGLRVAAEGEAVFAAVRALFARAEADTALRQFAVLDGFQPVFAGVQLSGFETELPLAVVVFEVAAPVATVIPYRAEAQPCRLETSPRFGTGGQAS